MRLRHYFLLAGAIVLFAALVFAILPAAAAGQPAPVADENDACLACHQVEDFQTTLKSGETLPLNVDPLKFRTSVHGENGVTCVQCHTGFQPTDGHEFNATSRREVTLRMNETCAQCHETQAKLQGDSVHNMAFSNGNMNAAVCTDCHTAHDVHRVTDPNTGELLPDTRAWIPTACQKCHGEIYEKYRNSVHGAALTDENNPDVPTCIDCHGVHSIGDPTTTAFRLNSPQLCAKCHTDSGIMDKYGISTDVLDTYVADFHGTTVSIFEKVSPDSATDKPVCYDCHGVHDIAAADDPEKGLKVKENLLVRCQACHPDATANFPDAWLSHYIPNSDVYPVVFYVDLFYKLLIPAALLPMIILVIMDFTRKMINRFRKVTPETDEHKTPKSHATDEEANYE